MISASSSMSVAAAKRYFGPRRVIAAFFAVTVTLPARL